ncbi:SseB family protein [Microbacterium sp. nov. GSS16]|uniref:SseB family protein n=1 Tax=Microbacterium sp. nov. GSS16 TaxID=3019890 RepID=UPI0023064327|nr:SseB family protein [Microbacterium sp. nov. GSS16]WCD92802.1 SseB family protein [Microbacterium sp. nov. GSS16]
MALFSRRKKSDDQPTAPAAPAAEAESVEEPATDVPAEPVPDVSISVQAFRGVGADAGPEVSLPTEDASQSAPPRTAPARSSSPSAQGLPGEQQPASPSEQTVPRLPLAPALPPEQTNTVDGLNDNVLLREALAELQEGATNEQLIGVMRQSLQGHLYLRVNGDAREQISSGKPLSVGVIRDGDRSFMLAYSSGRALQQSIEGAEDAAATSAIAQPTTAVYQQVIAGGFTGIIIDNSSAPHRAVFPTELLQKALEQGDENMAIKTALAAPRDEQSAVRVAEALAGTRCWVAVNDGSNGQPVGIAEAHATDGRRFLQVFSHPLEVVALGRKDRPLPFQPEQLAKILSEHSGIAGVLVDIAGPSIAVERDALSAVLVLGIDIDDE